MKKVRNILIFTVIIAYLILTLGFVSSRQSELVCNMIVVKIVDSAENGFIKPRDIINLLYNRNIRLIGKNFKNINLPSIESEINTFPPVERAEVYKTAGGKVVVEIEQRNPIVRVFDELDQSYYIDDKGFLMHLSGKFTSHVPVANGFIKTPIHIEKGINVNSLQKPGKRSVLTELYQLAKFIDEHEFWKAQIQQIYVNSDNEFELIPRVGSQIIVFGDISDCEEKFINLESLYINALNTVGWNKYEKINLKYKGQVVCTKR
jgi:cell division protein FtsQ